MPRTTRNSPLEYITRLADNRDTLREKVDDLTQEMQDVVIEWGTEQQKVKHLTETITDLDASLDNHIDACDEFTLELLKLREKFEDANSVLGFYSYSDTDFAFEISRLRQENRDLFHALSRDKSHTTTVTFCHTFNNYDHTK